MIYKKITELIGNTPLFEIPFEFHKIDNFKLYAKLEYFNPWGSVKDRTAFGLLEKNLENLKNKKVIESSSSNTAKALQMLSSINWGSMETITNRIKVEEQRDILKLFGAKIIELPGKSECPDPNDPSNPQIIIEQQIKNSKEDYIYTDQYNNFDNINYHYKTTGKEISHDLNKVDYVFGGLGTTGSIGGISKCLKESNSNLETIGIVSSKDDFIPGIRNIDEVIEVGLFNPKEYQEIIEINSTQAVEMSLKLIRELGLIVGPTTGATLAGIKSFFENKTLASPTTGVFIACDRAEPYISYFKERKPEIFNLNNFEKWDENLKIDNSVEISSDNLLDFINKFHPLIIDLRSAVSFKIAHLSSSVNFSFDLLNQSLNQEIPFSSDKKLLFICAVGEKSLKVASFLKSKNFQAFSVQNGINTCRDLEMKFINNL